jgi:hypothetical protein
VRIIIINTRANSTRFSCPICKVTSICDIQYMNCNGLDGRSSETYFLICRACSDGSVWKQFDRQDNIRYKLRLVDPILPNAPVATADMPEDVRADFEEARLVTNFSPRASAALLRLALQKLCRHLGEPGKHIDTDIRSLAKRPEFGERLVKAADTLRITGNNAVHPGEMSGEDIDNVSMGLFELLNLIVQSGITEPKKWDAMYDSLPEKPRKSAENKDRGA